jgi:receptor protein-tyrosine kinase
VHEHEQVSLDIEKLRFEGALPPLNCERQLTEQYRRIKRPLVAFAHGSSHPNGQISDSLIMVTSSFPAEGKSFTSLNLAISLSLEKDATVLLVDADVANPRLSRLLAQQGARGLFDSLGDQSLDVEQLVVNTDIPGLSFLAAGATTEESAELLASHRMAELMAALVANDPRRLVVLDSPPLLLTNESRELASVAGQVLLVVRAGVTPRESVKEAIDLIPDGKHVGIVLNQVDPASSDVNYYGYGRYGAYGDRAGAANGA